MNQARCLRNRFLLAILAPFLMTACSDTKIEFFKFSSGFTLPDFQTITDQNVDELNAISKIQPQFDGISTDISSLGIEFQCYYDSTANSLVDENSATKCTEIRDFQFSSTTGVISWTPNASQSGTYEIKLIAKKDNSKKEVLFTLTINDTASNAAPVITQSCATSHTQDAAYSCTVSATDADGDTITWVMDATNACAWLSIDANTGVITGTPSDDQVGICNLKFKADDGQAYSTVEVVAISVNNISPTLSVADPASLTEDDLMTTIRADIDVSASEEGLGVYSINLGTSTCDDFAYNAGADLIIDPNTGEIQFRPAANYYGTCTIDIVFDDQNADFGAPSTVTDSISVGVTGVPDIPTITAACATTGTEAVGYSCTPAFNDVDGDTITSWQFGLGHTCGGWLSIHATTGVISGTPSNSDVGTCHLAFSVTDTGGGTSVLTEYDITIDNVAPTLSIANANPLIKTAVATIIRSDAQVQADVEGVGSTTYSLDNASVTSPKCNDNATSLTIDSGNGSIQMDPDGIFTGVCYIKVVFDDGNTSNNTVSAEFSIEIYQTLNIFRSVGPLATNPIMDGATASIQMNLVANEATFSLALLDRVGVGDAISYDSDGNTTVDKIAFISKRLTNNTFKVQNATGFNPTDSTSNTVNWKIHRAYTGLNDAVKGIENTGIDAGLRNFDTWSIINNIVAANANWHIAVYGGENPTDIDATPVAMSGWTTDGAHQLRIFAPDKAFEVGETQKHKGAWNTSYYQLKVIESTSVALRLNTTANVTVDGLQISTESTGTGAPGPVAILSNPTAAGNLVTIKNTLIKAKATGLNNTGGFYLGAEDTNFQLFNNMIYVESNNSSSKAITVVESTPLEKKFYNNTIYVTGQASGISGGGGGGTTLINNLVDCSTSSGSCYSGVFDSGNSSNNASSDGTAVGTNGLLNNTIELIDPINLDLKVSRVGKIYLTTQAGADLTASGISDDITGATRTTPWTIGAFQFPSGLQICQAGFVFVPGNATYGTAGGLCVSKYEIKDLINSPKSDSTTTPILNWANRSDAQTACSNFLALGNPRLISNNEWQTIARDIEKVSSNWYQGKKYSLNSYLNRGNSSVSPGCSATLDAVSGTCTTPSTLFKDKRTHTLSNGSVIWDFSGNLSEWVTDDWSTDYSGLASFPNPQNYASIVGSTNATAKLEFGPFNSYSYAGGGYGYFGELINISGQTPGFALYRGGSYSDGANIGVFQAQSQVSTYTSGDLGLRCVHDPL